MSIAHMLDDFTSLADGEPVDMTDVSLEELKLEAFEKGYTAGWDDAVKSQAESSTQFTADLAQNLQDVSFTLTEAQQRLIKQLEPLLAGILDTLLPKVAKESLGAHLLEQMIELAVQTLDANAEIRVSPETRQTIEDIVPAVPSMQVRVCEDPHLGAGQIQLTVGPRESEIDFGSVLASMADSVTEFFQNGENEKDTSHG